MRVCWTKEEERLREGFAELGAGFGPPEGAFHQTAWEALCAQGLWDLVIRERPDWWGFAAALEGLCSRLRHPGLALSVIGQAGMVRALELYGSAEQKARYLPRMARGELSATAIADPGSGTDVRASSTFLTERGGQMFLNGAKYNIAHGDIASFILVVCKLSGQGRQGVTLVLIEAEREGVRFGPRDMKLGNHDLPTGPIHFDDVAIAPADILGQAGRGLSSLIRIVSLGRLLYGLAGAWMVEPFLHDALTYAQSRQTFGTAVINHQYVQSRLTDIRIRRDTARWAAYGALDELLRDDSAAILSASVAKLTGAQAVTASAQDLLQLYGSLGYHNGPVSGFLRDAMAFHAVGGTEEMHRRTIMAQMERGVA